VFYRRKFLLSLIEIFGGLLPKTDCQQLVFLFCLRQGKNYYDFFPHKEGSFSFILAQDKKRLTDLGFLTPHNDFLLQSKQSYIDQIKEKDLQALYALASEAGNLRGDALMRKTFLEFPHYASQSELAAKILTQAEYEQIRRNRNSNTAPCLFTIGYEGLSIDAYLNILISNNVTALVDVRKNPVSMKYGFSKTKLAKCLAETGIAYIHLPDLGIPSSMRQELSSRDAYQKLFDYYSSQILQHQKNALARLKTIAYDLERIALTCFEADHRFCHRSSITEYLENDPDFDLAIVHLHKDDRSFTMPQNQSFPHRHWSKNALYSST
jgi:uncharacterized protein (DUF488 family)